MPSALIAIFVSCTGLLILTVEPPIVLSICHPATLFAVALKLSFTRGMQRPNTHPNLGADILDHPGLWCQQGCGNKSIREYTSKLGKDPCLFGRIFSFSFALCS